MNFNLLFGYLITVNLIAFLTFGIDKWLASSGRRRISENTLFLLSFFGGSPGALIAQQMFRHKTAKRPFQIRFWAIVILQLVLLVIFYQFQ
ncbi:MAG: DUF1294 domain-containing protein [Chloroflexota bacterium]